MYIMPVKSFCTTHKGSMKIPKSASIKNQEKMDNIQALKLANIFEKFENDFRTTIKTFVHTVKI